MRTRAVHVALERGQLVAKLRDFAAERLDLAFVLHPRSLAWV
jgi:hypothetical protein